MVEAVSNPGTLSVIRRFRPHADLQGIRADYYNLTDLQGAPLAGLLVLMDRRGRPVRAEIHMSNTSADALYEIAVRQSLRLIEDRYKSDRPVRLYPLRMQLETDPLSVQPRARASNPGRGAGAGVGKPPIAGGRSAPRDFCAVRWLVPQRMVHRRPYPVQSAGHTCCEFILGGRWTRCPHRRNQWAAPQPQRNPDECGRSYPAPARIQDLTAHRSRGTCRRHRRLSARRRSYDNSQRPDLAARQQRYHRLVVCAVGWRFPRLGTCQYQ